MSSSPHTLAEWSHVASSAAQVYLNSIMMMSNVTVNYLAAFGPYVKVVEQMAVEVGTIPPSVCIGSSSKTIAQSGGTTKLSHSAGIVATCSPVDKRVTTFCTLPLKYNITVNEWTEDPNCPVAAFLRPLFNDDTEYDTLRWVVGNCLLDPPTPAVFPILYGQGGSGKSTLLSSLLAMMPGCSSSLDVSSVITSRQERVPREMIEVLVSNRLTVCGEVDLARGPLNTHFMKLATGNDSMSLPPFSATTRSSVMVATNTLPDPSGNAAWRTPALMRRVTILPMTKKALELTPRALTKSQESRLGWLMSCLNVRLNNTPAPHKHQVSAPDPLCL